MRPHTLHLFVASFVTAVMFVLICWRRPLAPLSASQLYFFSHHISNMWRRILYPTHAHAFLFPICAPSLCLPNLRGSGGGRMFFTLAPSFFLLPISCGSLVYVTSLQNIQRAANMLVLCLLFQLAFTSCVPYCILCLVRTCSFVLYFLQMSHVCTS